MQNLRASTKTPERFVLSIVHYDDKQRETRAIMKIRTILLYLMLMSSLAGCNWSPPRDNLRDPGSSDYDGPPVIQRVWIETRCQLFAMDYCGMDIYANVYDPEGISTLDTAWVYLDEDCLGQMQYDAAENRFVLSLDENSNELPDRLENYLGAEFIVRFRDDVGYAIQESVQITRVIRNYPRPEWPAEPEAIVVCTTQHPRFQWRQYFVAWPFTYAVHCYLDPNNYLLWDSCGIQSDCTNVLLDGNDSLENSIDPNIWYSWTVSVVDSAGDKATSQRFRFVVSVQ